jgi:hypothetical protein
MIVINYLNGIERGVSNELVEMLFRDVKVKIPFLCASMSPRI